MSFFNKVDIEQIRNELRMVELKVQQLERERLDRELQVQDQLEKLNRLYARLRMAAQRAERDEVKVESVRPQPFGRRAP